MNNTIIGNNSNNDDCFGTVTANSYNLDTDGSCDNATQKTLVQINLAALADNGGPTQTHALLVGSQAIDAGDNTVCNIAPVSNFDQRDYLRDASCDVGSYEYGALDTVAPTVVSFAATSPSSSLNIPITAFTASDAEGVTGYMVTTSSTPPAVGDVGWSGTVPAVYTVITDGDYTLYPWAKDATGNISTVFAPASVTVDTTAPIVSSSLRASTSPSALPSVNFTVTFSESVTGVDTSDFNLTTTGVSGATVSGLSGTGSLYTVSVNTGSGDGTIRLNVLNNGSIKDIALNPLGLAFSSGEVYTISKPATFSDVSLTYWASSYIERLYHAGITGGCGTGIYCPDATVTRAQMAVFLLKGMHGSSYIPPAVGLTTGFGDVATDYWAAAWIKQLAAEGITGGCGGGNYCPDATVTRAQMAIFLLKAKHGSSYSPPNASGVFIDVPVGYWADKWIEQLASEGVTSGCGNGNYCPDDSVTRAQMAVFLVKAFNLP
ncbi:MAG: S-layer homology domain-containing protein [Anaerolineales bacterium]|nr:S-layer homology domain-containing protein [Anaerolineales bacterium]